MNGRDLSGTVMCGRDICTLVYYDGYVYTCKLEVYVDFDRSYGIVDGVRTRTPYAEGGNRDSLQSYVKACVDSTLTNMDEEDLLHGWGDCRPIVISDKYLYFDEDFHKDLCAYNGYPDTPYGLTMLIHDAWVATFDRLPTAPLRMSGVAPKPRHRKW